MTSGSLLGDEVITDAVVLGHVTRQVITDEAITDAFETRVLSPNYRARTRGLGYTPSTFRHRISPPLAWAISRAPGSTGLASSLRGLAKPTTSVMTGGGRIW